MPDNIVHVIINDFSRSYLIESFAINNALEGSIISLKDDLRIGPVKDLQLPDNRDARLNWLSSFYREDDLIKDNPQKYIQNSLADFEALKAIKAHLQDKRQVIIWVGTDTVNQLGFARLCYTLSSNLSDAYMIPISEGRITTPYMDNFIPKSLVVLKPEQIASLFKLIRLVKDSEIENGIQLWEKISVENSMLRTISNNSEVESFDPDYFDSYLLARCTDTFQKAARVIGYTLVDADFEVNDLTLDQRLQELVKLNKLEVKGILRHMRDYEVRLL